MSDQTDEVNRLLSSGARSAKFETIGTTVKGTITELRVEQQRDFDTGEPLWWIGKKPSTAGNPAVDKPVMMVVVTLQTDENEGADDDGLRNLYVKFMMHRAVADAIKKVGARLAVGGILAVRYSSDGEANGRKQPPKLYTAQYQPPTPSAVDADDLI